MSKRSHSGEPNGLTAKPSIEESDLSAYRINFDAVTLYATDERAAVESLLELTTQGDANPMDLFDVQER